MAHIAITETYYDVENLIFDTIRKFQQRYGGDFEDYASLANEIFLRAYRTYQPGKGKFTSWLVYLVRIQMLEMVRRGAMRNARLPRVYPEMEKMTKESFSLRDFTFELSDDAQTIIHMIFEMPNDVKLAVMERGGPDEPRNIRSGVREVLSDLGWAGDRIKESFNEIREALTA